MGTLSRNDMEQAIVQKGSVLYQSRIISRIQDLPTDADLAKGNPEQEALAAAALDAQIAALMAQREQLKVAQAPRNTGEITASPDTPPSEDAESGTGEKKDTRRRAAPAGAGRE